MMVLGLKRWMARIAVVALALTGGVLSAGLVVAGSSAAVAQTTQPTINRVVFEGNKKLIDSQLEQFIESKPKTRLNEQVLNGDVERLREAYARAAGRGQAAISVRTVPLGNNLVDVVFTINEGDKIGIARIEFVGNNAFSASRLKRQIATTESGLLSWIRTTDVYDPGRVAADEEALRRFYNRRGFPDFRVVSSVAVYDPQREGYVLTFTLEEGPQFRFGASTVESTIPEIAPDALRRDIWTRDGRLYNYILVDRTIEDMVDRLSGQGFPFAEVRPRGVRDPQTGRLDITYVVEEGARVYIDRLEVRGNTRTRDYVIRREFDIAEGDPFNQTLIDRGLRRLRNLGFFETVSVVTEPGQAPDRVVVIVNVVDKPTGEFSVGGGYSTSDGWVAEVSLTERNFLGRGQFVRAAAKFGEFTSGANLSFTEPYFMGQRIAAGFDIFSNTNDANSYQYYSETTTGGTLRASMPITEDLRFGVRYNGYVQDISIPADDEDQVSIAIKELEGQRFVSLVGYTLGYNTLDDIRQPTTGWAAEFRQDIAGLGGNAHFVRSVLDGRYYYPVLDDLTAMFRLQGGHMWAYNDEPLAITDQFNLGPDLVRGFAPGGIGPRDIANGNGQGNPLGGTIFYGASVELQFPILGLPRELGLRGALFADAGTLYDYQGQTYTEDFELVDSSIIRTSVGGSILWASPIGPLRFDFAQWLTKDTYDETQFFRFSGGTTF